MRRVTAMLTPVQDKLFPCLLFLTYWQTHKIATLNVNCVSAMTRLRMLTEFLHKQETDIILLQEVAHTNFDLIRGYNT
jgi:Exonuclease III